MSETFSAFAILSQRQCGLVRAVFTAMQGVKFQAFTLGASAQVELDGDELRAFLRALPIHLLNDAMQHAVYECPNQFFALDAEDRPEAPSLQGSGYGQHD